MKRNLKYIFVGIMFIITLNFMLHKTHSKTVEKTFTRSELRELVVSTALSYYYNKNYSDYDQYSMDAKLESPYQYSSFNWRNVNNTPEMVNRANEYNIDCSSFVLMTYIHSLGYDMAEYLEYFPKNYIYENLKKTLVDTKEEYKKTYKMYGKGFSTGSVSQAASNVAGHTKTVGKEYIKNSNSNTTSIVYHYKVNLKSNYTYTETASEITNIKNNIINTLKPGDILVYRRKKKASGDETGHMVLYIGGAINSNEKGFIHSTGTDYKPDNDPITIGDDTYAIRYDTWESLFKSQIFINSSTIASSEFTIIRPINTYCESGKDSCSLAIDTNVIARNDLSKLRIEQYQSAPGKTTIKSLGKYNSVNNGDEIKYNLILTNMSKFNYCEKGAPDYNTKENCEKAGLKWKTTNNEEITYKNLKVVGKIPEGTTYANECSDNCVYDKENKTVTWNISEITPSNYDALTYTVKVTTDEDITNPGIEIITPNKNSLALGSLTTQINPTFVKQKNKDEISNEINKFAKLAKDGKIVYNTETSGSNYKIDLDKITTSIEISKLGFIKSIYYNAYSLDLDFLTSSNIKSAIFNTDTNYNVFSKKTENQITALTNGNYQKINKMLVKGMYGGRLLKGNDNGDRARKFITTYFEFGDIIITFDKNKLAINGAYIFSGFDSNGDSIVTEYKKNDSGKGEVFVYDANLKYGKSGYRTIKELFAQGLFVVLRPSQLYGTTIKYNYNGGTKTIDNYLVFNEYKNLETPTKKDYVVTLKYNGGTETDMPKTKNASNKFANWYSDKELTKEVKSGTKITSSSTHSLYAKWNTEKVELPEPVRDGYVFDGWYTSKDIKVSNEYTPTANITLYAKWKDIEGKVDGEIGKDEEPENQEPEPEKPPVEEKEELREDKNNNIESDAELFDKDSEEIPGGDDSTDEISNGENTDNENQPPENNTNNDVNKEEKPSSNSKVEDKESGEASNNENVEENPKTGSKISIFVILLLIGGCIVTFVIFNPSKQF